MQRVLFCSSVKGKGSIVRHLEPNLCIDDDRTVLLTLKPFIDQVALVQGRDLTAAAAAAAAPADTVPTFASLAHFFTPTR